MKYFVKATVLIIVCMQIITGSIAQVNLQTGSATFTLPMFNWQDGKSRLNAIIALNYNSGSGLKVNDVASNVGTGWNLLAGGMISRLQVGEPDDQKLYNGTEENGINKFPSGYLYNLANSAGCPLQLAQYPIFENENQVYKQPNEFTADTQLDYFSFSFNGRTGLFIINKNSFIPGASKGEAVSIGENKLKLSFTTDNNITASDGKGVRTTIKSFQIQDENGLIYTFGKIGLTKLLRNHPCNAFQLKLTTQPEFEDGKNYFEAMYDEINFKPYVATNWYLTKIEDPLTKREVLFNYIERKVRDNGGEMINNIRSNSINYNNISYKLSISLTPVLSEIKMPDGHKVKLNYESRYERFDLKGDYALSSLDVTYNNRYLFKYLLTSEYFVYNSIKIPLLDEEKKAARLCLKSVQKIKVDLKEADPAYSFEYYTGSNAAFDIVPPRFCLLKDIWGYYNGSRSNDKNTSAPVSYTSLLYNLDYTQIMSLCFVNSTGYENASYFENIEENYARNGLLKLIIQPVGARIKYDYEQNKEGTLNKITGGVSVAKTTISDPVNKLKVTNYKYVKPDGNESSLLGTETPINSNYIKSLYHREVHVPRPIYECPLFSPCCRFKYRYQGILYSENSLNTAASSDVGYTIYIILNTIETAFNLWAAIVNQDQDTNNRLTKTIINLVLAVFLQIKETCLDDDEVQFRESIVYSNYSLASLNPLPLQYNRIEVIEESVNNILTSNGKTVYEFTSANTNGNYLWEPENITLGQKQRYGYWTYGLPEKISIYDKDGYIIRQQINIYDNSEIKKNIPNTLCWSYKLKRVSSIKESNYFVSPSYIINSTDDIDVESYSIYTGHLNLQESKERVYQPQTIDADDASKYLETSTSYIYSNNNYQPRSIKTYQSNGDLLTKELYYSADYTVTGILQTMRENNMVNVPVAEFVLVTKAQPGGCGSCPPQFPKYLGAQVTKFGQLDDGNIKPVEIEKSYSFVQNFINTPSLNFNFDPNNTLNYPDLKVVETFSYDASGNLVNHIDESYHSTANIYDYDDRYVVASIDNTNSLLDNPAYTSFETAKLGNWHLTNGVLQYSTALSVTGNSSVDLQGCVLTAQNLNSKKKYRISFWSTGNVTVSNGAVAFSYGQAVVINGFTYYQFELPAGATSVSLSGTGNIDELRLYPANARMRTVTYNVLKGKTDECDANNRITYYEYDNHGRISLIKDEKKDIIKRYSYRATDGANWTNTTTAQRCMQVTSIDGTLYNTGMAEQEQRDINLLSETFNVTRWVGVGINTILCPLTPNAIYVRMIPDVDRSPLTTSQLGLRRLVFKFYSDPVCTVEIPVPELTINYRKSDNCYLPAVQESVICHCDPGDFACAGNQYITFGNYSYLGPPQGSLTPQCRVTYKLLPGTGYIAMP